jgi:hypothetical protein
MHCRPTPGLLEVDYAYGFTHLYGFTHFVPKTIYDLGCRPKFRTLSPKWYMQEGPQTASAQRDSGTCCKSFSFSYRYIGCCLMAFPILLSKTQGQGFTPGVSLSIPLRRQ